MTVAATAFGQRGGKRMRQRGRGYERLGWMEQGADWFTVSWGRMFACRERSQEGIGVTRCEGKTPSSVPGPLETANSKVLMQMLRRFPGSVYYEGSQPES